MRQCACVPISFQLLYIKTSKKILDHFKFGACFSLSLTLHSLENLVTACCFPDFSAHLSKFSQLKFRESVQFANIAKILPRENFPLYGSFTRCAMVILVQVTPVTSSTWLPKRRFYHRHSILRVLPSLE